MGTAIAMSTGTQTQALWKQFRWADRGNSVDGAVEAVQNAGGWAVRDDGQLCVAVGAEIDPERAAGSRNFEGFALGLTAQFYALYSG